MVRYTANRYGEVFSTSSRRNTGRGRSGRPEKTVSVSNLWSRHWAWLQRRGPRGKVLTVSLLWPTVLVVVAALVMAAVVVAAIGGLIYLIIVVARSD